MFIYYRILITARKEYLYSFAENVPLIVYSECFLEGRVDGYMASEFVLRVINDNKCSASGGSVVDRSDVAST